MADASTSTGGRGDGGGGGEPDTDGNPIVYRPYVGESDLPNIMALVQSELSEPYVIYTYRYFLQQW